MVVIKIKYMDGDGSSTIEFSDTPPNEKYFSIDWKYDKTTLFNPYNRF